MLSGTFGTSVEDRVRMITRANESLVKGKKTYEVTFTRFDALYDRETEMSTLPTQDKTRAQEQYKTRKSNPHYKNVKMLTYTY